MPDIDPDRRYPTGPAAKLLGVSRATLIVRIKAGQIKATQLAPIGNGTPHRRVEGRELLRALGLAEKPPTPPPTKPPAPKRRSSQAARNHLRALKQLGCM